MGRPSRWLTWDGDEQAQAQAAAAREDAERARRARPEFRYSGYHFACATLSRRSEDWQLGFGDFEGRACSESIVIDGARCLVFRTENGFVAVSHANRADLKAL